MPTIHHLVNHIQLYKSKHRHLYVLGMMILFWMIFEGIISYITPLLIVQNGISEMKMGFIIGLASVAGAIFDFLMCWMFKNARHRRMLIIMFTICAIFPVILFQARTAQMFIFAMILWGIFYDLHNVSNFEFVGSHIEKDEHVSSFGLIQVAQSLGYLLAPILAGLVVGKSVGWQPFVMAWIFLVISFLFFIILGFVSKKEREVFSLRENCRPIKFLLEISLWHRIGRLIAPVLILTGLLNVTEAFFWTVGPILSESFSRYHQFAGLFMVAFTLPPLLVGGIVGNITSKYGKKNTAFRSFLLGSVVLSSFFLFRNPIVLLGIVFLSSFCFAFSWPSINGVYADFVSESKEYRREVEALEDLFVNFGYVIGPILAGLFASAVGNNMAFSLLGIVGVLAAIILIRITPKKIKVKEVAQTPSRFSIVNEIESQ